MRREPSAKVVEKARHLRLLGMTRRLAFVEGYSDVYIVWIKYRLCNCKAGRVGMVCSHLLAVLAERDNKRVEDIKL